MHDHVNSINRVVASSLQVGLKEVVGVGCMGLVVSTTKARLNHMAHRPPIFFNSSLEMKA